LFAQVEAAGFYPDIVLTEIERALAGETVLAGVVLPAMYFDANIKSSPSSRLTSAPPTRTGSMPGASTGSPAN
jgi:hypothetical protein